MPIIHIKPLSVNEGYQGKRFKTKTFKHWEEAVLLMLPKELLIPAYPLELYLKFGYSSRSSDWDNGIKHFQDALAKKYRFNDKQIRRAVIETEIVPKGKEFIQWELSHYEIRTERHLI